MTPRNRAQRPVGTSAKIQAATPARLFRGLAGLRGLRRAVHVSAEQYHRLR
jgi:hypothetical protein